MKEWTTQASIRQLREITETVDAWLEGFGCPMKAQIQIDLAVDELFSNIANYAYAPASGDVTVRLEFDAAARTVSVTFIDRGIPFDPLQKADPDVSLSAEDRKVGGLGIFLVKRTMDGMEYRREADCNILTIRKKI
ncbi:MAG: ATP-binding protein [Oscillospiraceae bacterium]|nr:ATP-binding protein [Oscillospiraceae bacterium]